MGIMLIPKPPTTDPVGRTAGASVGSPFEAGSNALPLSDEGWHATITNSQFCGHDRTMGDPGPQGARKDGRLQCPARPSGPGLTVMTSLSCLTLWYSPCPCQDGGV